MDQKQADINSRAEKIKAIIEGTKPMKQTSPIYGKVVKIKATRKNRPQPSIVPPPSEPVRDINQLTGRLNEKFIEMLDELAGFMVKRGEPFKARAYQKAQETVILHLDDITPENYANLKSAPGIGETIMKKFTEFVQTGTLRVLERERADPMNVFADIYGVGPKKAKDLVEKGVRTIVELRERQSELLNAIQRVGLKYYEDILERIPRKEVQEYKIVFKREFDKVVDQVGEPGINSPKFEIVGSYRRGAKSSGDIDVIVTSPSSDVFKQYIDRLVETGIIVEILSRGPTKSLVIGKLPGADHARRLDFLYSSPEEYPFAVLYFTGSKIFNTVMRGRALTMGYSLNEHGMYVMEGKKKGGKVDAKFADERAIFAFLKMEYKEPEERIDGRAVVALSGSPKIDLVQDLDINLLEEAPPSLPVEPMPIASSKKKTRKIRVVGKTKEEKAAEKEAEKAAKLAAKEEMKAAEKAAKLAAKETEKAEKLEVKKLEKELKLQEKKAAKEISRKALSEVKKAAKSEKNVTRKKRAISPVPVPMPTPVPSIELPKINLKTSPKTKKRREREMKPKMSKSKTLKVVAPVVVEAERPTVPVIEDTAILHALEHFKTSGQSVLDNLSEETLNAMLVKSNDMYYNIETFTKPNAPLTDNEYDILKEFIERKYPKNTVVKEVGAPTNARNKVTLPYQMASMDKIKPDTGALQSWKSKYKGPYVLSCKLDGVSGMYSTENGEPKLYTRGNGRIGQDVSHMIPYLRLPEIEDGIVVRGEFIMSKATFTAKYADQFANIRNLVAGTVNRLVADEKVRDIDFVTYEVIRPELKPSEQMSFLAEKGFIVVQNEVWTEFGKGRSVSGDSRVIPGEKQPTGVSQELTNDELSAVLVNWRQNYKYEIDGVIVADDHIHPRTSGNPDYAFAFKMVLSDQMAEAKVVDVIWTASKDGYLKPRVQIEPVRLSGVTIEFATGFNGSFIETNKIGIGAVIQLIRSGDVIPYIKSVIVPAEQPKMPAVPYKWNATHIDVLLEDPGEDATVREKNIAGFFKGIEVDGIGAGNVAKIVAAGFDTIPKILAMSKDDFLTVDGFKEKTAAKLYEGIKSKVAGASLADIMAASNMFGRGFSNKRIAAILEQYPDILTSVEMSEDKVKKLMGVEGVASKTAKLFVENIPQFLGFLEECDLMSKLSTISTVSTLANIEIDVTHALYKKSIVMSGTRDKALEKKLMDVGATIGSSVSKNTFAVITPDVSATTGKVGAARQLGIQIMTPDDFKSTYNL